MCVVNPVPSELHSTWSICLTHSHLIFDDLSWLQHCQSLPEDCDESMQATCDINTMCPKPHAGIHNRGAQLGIGPRTGNHHLGLLDNAVDGGLIRGISCQDWHILHMGTQVLCCHEQSCSP